MKKAKQTLCMITASVLLFTAFLCAGILFGDFAEKKENEQSFVEIAQTVENVRQDSTEAEIVAEDDETEQILSVYRDLAEENPHMIGWVEIEGTTVNYPVMYTPDSPSYYLRRNFSREYSDLGTPFMQENCEPYVGANRLIYGHNMLRGGMFSDLELYREKSFWEGHRRIRFDTLQSTGEYEIFAVFSVDVTKSGWYRFHDYTDGDEKNFSKYVEECKKRSFYDTGVQPQYGEKLIALVTCEYNNGDGRLVVAAREIGGTK